MSLKINTISPLYASQGFEPLLKPGDAELVNEVTCYEGRAFALGDRLLTKEDIRGFATGKLKNDENIAITEAHAAALNRLADLMEKHGVDFVN